VKRYCCDCYAVSDELFLHNRNLWVVKIITYPQIEVIKNENRRGNIIWFLSFFLPSLRCRDADGRLAIGRR